MIERFSSYLENRVAELKALKDQGVKIIGYCPSGYMPVELVYACDAVPVGLIRGGDPEAVALSNAYSSRFIDTFCRSQIAYRMLNKDPVYQMIDLLICPQTDNHIKAIADSFQYYTKTRIFRFGVPRNKEKEAFDYYLEGLYQLKDELERFVGVKILDTKLREATVLYNDIRELMQKISLMRKSEDVHITGKEFSMLNHISYYADPVNFKHLLESILKQLNNRHVPTPKPRILLTGSTLAYGDYKIFDLVEEAGAAIVVEEFAEGIRQYWHKVQLDGDPLEALATRYFLKRVPPAFFCPSRERIDFVLQTAKDFNVDGILWYQLMYRESYDMQSFYFKSILEKKLGIPMLKLQSDYDASEVGLMKTRVQTFIETIRSR